MPGIADNSAQVEAVLQLAQATGVGIHHGDVIGLGHQVLGDGAADLTGSQDDDAHSRFSPANGRWHKGAAAHPEKERNCIPALPRE